MAVAFSYLYRDGGNYKEFGEVVFAGELTPALEARLRAALDSGEWFIADQVGVPEVFLWSGKGKSLTADDHSYHEFDGVQESAAAVTDAKGRPFGAFVAEVEAASRAGWRVFDPWERLYYGRVA